MDKSDFDFLTISVHISKSFCAKLLLAKDTDGASPYPLAFELPGCLSEEVIQTSGKRQAAELALNVPTADLNTAFPIENSI